MPERTAKIIEIGGNGSTFAAFFTGLGAAFGGGFAWLNTNYLAIMAICAVFTSIIGAYGTMARIKIAKQQTRRESDEG